MQRKIIVTKPKFIDLCAGIGGFRIAFEKAGAQCTLTCEIDKFAKETYLANFNENHFEPDIKKIDEKSMENFDILCAGFPCQAFSLAGKQAGFADIRGTIFFDIVRILKEKRPKGFLLENVKNLKSHDKGNTFKVIQKNLDDLNYWHQDFIVNPQSLVPQRRERVYILGANKDLYTKEQFEKLVADVRADIVSTHQQAGKRFETILDKDDVEQYTLSDKLWSFLQQHAKKHAAAGNGFGYGLMNPDTDVTARTLTARYHKDGSEILVAQKGKNPRRLSPRECGRIMGFPEDFKIVVSKTQSYKQFGNSVVVPVISLFANHLVKFVK